MTSTSKIIRSFKSDGLDDFWPRYWKSTKNTFQPNWANFEVRRYDILKSQPKAVLSSQRSFTQIQGMDYLLKHDWNSSLLPGTWNGRNGHLHNILDEILSDKIQFRISLQYQCTGELPLCLWLWISYIYVLSYMGLLK